MLKENNSLGVCDEDTKPFDFCISHFCAKLNAGFKRAAMSSVLLGVLLGSSPVMAELVFKAIAGVHPDTRLNININQRNFNINVHGVVLVSDSERYYLTENAVDVLDIRASATGGVPWPPYCCFNNGDATINSDQEVVFAARVDGSIASREARLYRLKPPYEALEEFSNVPQGLRIINYVDVNDDGDGVFSAENSTEAGGGQKLYRFSHDGTVEFLADISSTGAHNRPRILNNGDIYYLQRNPDNEGRNELRRYLSGANESQLVISTPGFAIPLFDVNNDGDLVYVTSDSSDAQELRRNVNSIDESVIARGESSFVRVFIDDNDTLSVIEIRVSDSVYQIQYGNPLMPILTGIDVFDEHQVSNSNINLFESRMNRAGQLLFPVNFTDTSPVLYRLDPPMTDDDSPVLPEPPDLCAIGECWRFNIVVINLVARCSGSGCRSGYFDPEPALGYIYRSPHNPFTSIKIPKEYGDGQYDLLLLDAGTHQYVDTGIDLETDQLFNFATELGLSGGTDSIGIFGIEPEAAVDPTDPQGFVTGLTFLNGGQTEFFMWPITETTSLRPVANPGADDSVDEGNTYLLDGTGSIDPHGAPLSYHWLQIAGPAVDDLANDTTAQPSFTAPAVGSNQTVTFELVVKHDEVESAAKTVDIVVKNINSAPVADAGDDTSIREGLTVSLDGSQSYDPDLDSITGYHWIQVDGGEVELLPSNDVVSPSFTAPLGAGQQLVFKLQVSDGIEDSVLSIGNDSAANLDTVAVSVLSNSLPVVDAGAHQTKEELSEVTLKGTASDPDGDAMTFYWQHLDGPSVTLSDPTSLTPTFTAPEVGAAGADITFELTATDTYTPNPKTSLPDTTVVHVVNIGDPPNCDAAFPSVDELWPPNHVLTQVEIEGVGDPDSDFVIETIQILAVTQDEPVDGLGDGDTSPDASIAADGESVWLRAERSALGDGRVYTITFEASNDNGSCEGTVTVEVPRQRNGNASDSGLGIDSTF